jgi:type VI secretion system protein ImpE
MTSSELIKAGMLSEARRQLIEQVKAAPSDSSARTLLFQVLAYCGEWDKVKRHLDILAMQNVRAETGVQVYKNLVSAEKERSEVFRGERCPSFMTAVPPYLEDFLNFRDRLSREELQEAEELMTRIEAMVPEITGVADGFSFNGFRDSDAFLSLFLEFFVHDHYLWIPVTSLREISIQRPTTLLELLWIPARIVTWEGLTTSCFLPVLYPDSASHVNDLVRLGRMTDWKELSGGYYQGIGQHLFQVGEEEKGLLELREVTFNAPE